MVAATASEETASSAVRVHGAVIETVGKLT